MGQLHVLMAFDALDRAATLPVLRYLKPLLQRVAYPPFPQDKTA
jgi:hypothetical protein